MRRESRSDWSRSVRLGASPLSSRSYLQRRLGNGAREQAGELALAGAGLAVEQHVDAGRALVERRAERACQGIEVLVEMREIGAPELSGLELAHPAAYEIGGPLGARPEETPPGLA